MMPDCFDDFSFLRGNRLNCCRRRSGSGLRLFLSALLALYVGLEAIWLLGFDVLLCVHASRISTYGVDT
jgi:hypothetical protein